MSKYKIIIAILFMCNMMCLLLLAIKNNKIKICNIEYSGLEDITNQYIDHISELNLLYFMIKNEPSILYSVCADIDNEFTSINSVIEKDTLIYHFTKDACLACVESEIEGLDSLSKIYGIPVFVLCAGDDLIIRRLKHQFESVNIFRMKDSFFSDSFSDNFPELYLLVDENCHLISATIPIKNNKPINDFITLLSR